MRRPSLVVFARAPRPGRVKTRLTPPFSPEQAAALYAALLADVLDTSVRAADRLGLEAVLAVHPESAVAALAASAPAGFRVLAQRGPDLSARMEWAAAQAGAGGAPRVLLRGSDSPALDLELFEAALAGLERADLVLSPDRDGGYSLVGLRRPVPGLFSHPMGTDSVLADTWARAESLGLRVELLPGGFDLDVAADLRHLAEVRELGTPLPCPRLLRLLDERGLWEIADDHISEGAM